MVNWNEHLSQEVEQVFGVRYGRHSRDSEQNNYVIKFNLLTKVKLPAWELRSQTMPQQWVQRQISWAETKSVAAVKLADGQGLQELWDGGASGGVC